MKPASGFPLQRIAIAVALSILAHSLLLLKFPQIAFPEHKKPLPLLQAKLESLPRLAKKTAPHQEKIKSRAQHESTAKPAVDSAPPIVGAVSPAVTFAASKVEPADTLIETPSLNEETINPPLLPKHAQLRFAVQYGSGTFKVGEVLHVLENIDGRYMLRSSIQTTGLVSLFKNFNLSQISMGTISKQGLRPDSYEEVKEESGIPRASTASFDWTTHKVYFSNGTEMPLAEQAQDVLSLPYQLSRLPLNTNGIKVALSNGKNIAQYYLAVGDEEIISTTMGELRTITLSKVHGVNEEGLIIWLALEYRLLPVKILYLNKSGEVSANMVITDIRVSDE